MPSSVNSATLVAGSNCVQSVGRLKVMAAVGISVSTAISSGMANSGSKVSSWVGEHALRVTRTSSAPVGTLRPLVFRDMTIPLGADYRTCTMGKVAPR